MRNLTIRSYLNRQSHAAPLALFRIIFGLLMTVSIIRFAANGWIQKLYIEPQFFFSYYGFEWVKPLGEWTYLIFAICGLSALFVMAGYKYRLAIITFFLSFTYIELMDKTTYLNHYYFISILSFLMIFLPAHAHFSVDSFRNSELRSENVPSWSIDSIKLLMGIVWFYAGLAKLNSEWLLHAMPLAIWLPAKYSIPLLGDLLQKQWVHYAFSWGGALYDLAIPFLLLIKRTRWFAFILVVIFHALTRILFPIGMFPYIMIGSALIFFDAGFHRKILGMIAAALRIGKERFDNGAAYRFKKSLYRKATISLISIFFVAQLMIPFRYMLYPGELFWTEEGYRFSWRVMLMEKTGYAQFWIEDPESGRRMAVDNSRFLTPFQEKQMSTQPDFILEFAHMLEETYRSEGITDPEVYAESYVALNGRPSRPYVDPERDLTQIESSFKHRDWILPFDDEIKGL